MPSSTDPQRTCIACRLKAGQASFVRLTRNVDGLLSVVDHGPCQGRSAYVCPTKACAEAALAKGRLNRALRRHVPDDEIQRLSRQLECKLRERTTV